MSKSESDSGQITSPDWQICATSIGFDIDMRRRANGARRIGSHALVVATVSGHRIADPQRVHVVAVLDYLINKNG